MKVLHLVRKNTQLKASFIQNQILNHIEFIPIIIFYEHRNSIIDGGFASALTDNIMVHELVKKHTFFEKVQYKILKKINGISTKDLLKQIKQLNPQIIHLHYGTDAGIYLKAIQNINIPKVVSFYGYDAFSFPNKYFGLGKYFLRWFVFANATKVFAMSKEMKNDLIKVGCPPEKIVIHYHGVPIRLTSINRNFKKNKDVKLLMLSYLDPVKGHLFALKALKGIINNSTFEFKLRIVGSGHYEKNIKEFVASNRLAHCVEFVGAVKYLSNEYVEEFKNADIFIHPSVITKDDKEGIPGALVEAMFASLPVIATFHGGIPHVIENGKTGLLVNEWDEEALASAILFLSTNNLERKKIADLAREYAINNLSLQIKEKELEQIYKNLLK